MPRQGEGALFLSHLPTLADPPRSGEKSLYSRFALAFTPPVVAWVVPVVSCIGTGP